MASAICCSFIASFAHLWYLETSDTSEEMETKRERLRVRVNAEAGLTPRCPGLLSPGSLHSSRGVHRRGEVKQKMAVIPFLCQPLLGKHETRPSLRCACGL